MAKNQTSIKPGQVLNPGGRKKLPPDLKLLMRNTSEQMKKDLCDVYAMDLIELQTAESKSGLTAGKAAIISVLNNCLQTGDPRGLHIFLDRVLGKVKDAEIEGDEQLSTKDDTINRLVAMFADRGKNAT